MKYKLGVTVLPRHLMFLDELGKELRYKSRTKTLEYIIRKNSNKTFPIIPIYDGQSTIVYQVKINNSLVELMKQKSRELSISVSSIIRSIISIEEERWENRKQRAKSRKKET